MTVAPRDGIQQGATFSSGSSGFEAFASRWPIVLLPVRIETRFEPQSPTLLVRIYPDDLEIDTHEPELTEAEVAAGAEFWLQKHAGNEEEAWRKLLQSYPSTRAAWIVNATFTTADGDFHLFAVQKPSAWNSAAVTRVMPDRFVVRGYREGVLAFQAVGANVPDPLPVSLNPSADPNDPSLTVDISGHGLEIDRDIAWTVDFDKAVDAGMAMRIALTPTDVAQGFDELIVVGVKASLPPDSAAIRLAQLFDAHHLTRGFAFVPQGTPTTNTSGTRTTFPLPDPGGSRSFPIERGTPLNVAAGNGLAFTGALGLDPRLTEHVEHADLLDEPHARAFNTVLWPGTLGYYLRQMMLPLIGISIPDLPNARFRFSDTVDWEARSHFIEFVRGGASLPPFRIGDTVYGVLPVTSMRRWPEGKAGLAAELPRLLRDLLDVWTSRLDSVPRLGRTGDAEADLIATAGMDARSRSARIRWMLGPNANVNLLTFLGLSVSGWNTARQTIADSAMAAIGHAGSDALIGWMSFGETADRFGHELVASLLSDSDPLAPNYITWIRNASYDALRHELFDNATPRPQSLLYRMLRWSALTEYDRLATLMLAPLPLETDTPFGFRPDVELHGFAHEAVFNPFPEPIPIEIALTSGETLPPDTAWARLEATTPETGSQRIADYLLDAARAGDGLGAQSWRDALGAIESLSTAELERLFMSTLDTCSHRLDAWITSFATLRLRAMREQVPAGCYLGAYGWVENLRPGLFAVETLDDGRTAISQADSGGYIHAPTMTHASTAAVLRNAHLEPSGSDSDRYAVDLSSNRVQRALRVLDDVRSGEPLASSLGRQFEAGLRDRGWIPEFGLAIEQFRNAFPLVANKLADSQEEASLVAARSVVDGLRLLAAFREGVIDFDPVILPSGSSERDAVEAELALLENTIDAISDLLTAESVFQTMRGNTTATAATLETISRGVRPPELECIRQPRGGTTLTHRVAILLGDPAPSAPLWTASATPRSLAEPHLDGWYGRLLGDPATIRCLVNIPSPSLPDVFLTVEVSLADLALRPIDFVALAADPAELDLRIAFAVQSPGAVIEHTPWTDRTIRSFPEAIELALALRHVVATARPLRAADLVPPQNIADAKSVPAPDYGNRVANARHELSQTIRNALTTAVANSDPLALRTALDKASLYGIAGAFSPVPIAFSDLSDLGPRAANALEEIARRVAASAGKPPDETARVLFGADFLVLPSFTPPRPGDLSNALTHAPTLVGNDRFAVTGWLRKAAVVREPLARLAKMTSFATALSGAQVTYEVAQLPFTAGAAWVALPFAGETNRPRAGSVSIVLQRLSQPATTAKWCGLLLDEWSEIIPAAAEQTGVALEYENRHAEAPKAVLVAVPPSLALPWDTELLVDCVRETLQLAKVRAHDLETLADAGQLIPAVCVAENAAGDTITGGLSSLLSTPPTRHRVF